MTQEQLEKLENGLFEFENAFTELWKDDKEFDKTDNNTHAMVIAIRHYFNGELNYKLWCE